MVFHLNLRANLSTMKANVKQLPRNEQRRQQVKCKVQKST